MENFNKKTLYGVSKVLEVKQWSVWADGGIVTVEWGKLGGKMQTKSTACLPKNIGKINETSSSEQAKLEAQSKWNKQYDKYYRESVDEAKLILIEGVMLAEDYTKKPHLLADEFTVSRKFDGLRVKTIFTDGEPRWYSRGGKEYAIPKGIKEELIKLKELNDYEMLDGEAYLHNTKLQEIQSCVKKHNNLTPLLTYQVFDLPSDDEWVHRNKSLSTLFDDAEDLKYVKYVEQESVCKEELNGKLEQYISEGYEGVMIKNLKGKYLFQNKRSNDVLKYKIMMDSECKIVGCTEDKNGLGLFTVSWYNTCINKAVKFELSMNGSHEDNSYTNLKNCIGDWVNFKYQDITDKGIPTFARGLYFRDCKKDGTPSE